MLDAAELDSTDGDDAEDEPIVTDELDGGGVLGETDKTVGDVMLDESVEFAEAGRLCAEVELVETMELDAVDAFTIEDTVDNVLVDTAADVDELACEIALDAEPDTLCNEEGATLDEEGDAEVGV